jgi:hypothetical protein
MSKSDRDRMTRFRAVFNLNFEVCAASLLLLALMAALAAPRHAQAQTEAASAPEAASAVIPPPLPAPAAPPPGVTPPSPLPATVSNPPEWKALSLWQKWALSPLERDWNALDPARRSKWLEIAQRFPGLPADEQNRMHERMRAWARLSPAERQQARLGYQVAQQVKADDRQAKWEAYQALSPERRQELADKAAARKQSPKPRPAASRLDGEPVAKSNLVPPQLRAIPVKPVAPSVLQAKPGATTVLINQPGTPPRHQQAGTTKVFADPDLVDSKTLLPKRGTLSAVSR